MNSYKLIQIYPSIPKTMKEGDVVNFISSMGLYSHDSTLDTFTPQEVENNSKFWENLNLVNYEVTEDGVKIFEGDSYWFIWLKHPYVFQRVRQIYRIDSYKPSTMTKKAENSAWFSTLKAAEKYLSEIEPLFVTEDGHGIYGDGYDESYHIVNTNYMNYVGSVQYPSYSKKSSDKWLRFHSEEAAIEYIILHKKCLSLNDIQKIVGEVDTKDIRTTIVELIQERL